jgi:hypothetical protein
MLPTRPAGDLDVAIPGASTSPAGTPAHLDQPPARQQHRPYPVKSTLDMDTGIATIGGGVAGVIADAPVTWRLWRADGDLRRRAHHGLVHGGRHGDRAAVLNGLAAAAATAMDDPPVLCWQIDPQGDLDSGTAFTTNGNAAIAARLLEVEQTVARRVDQLTTEGAHWSHRPDMPLLLVLINADEGLLATRAPDGRSFAQILDRVARRAGHVGVAITLAAADLRHSLGGYQVLQTLLGQHNTLLLAATTPLTVARRRPMPVRRSEPDAVARRWRGTGQCLEIVGDVLGVIALVLVGANLFAVYGTLRSSGWGHPPTGLLVALLAVTAVGMPTAFTASAINARIRRRRTSAEQCRTPAVPD